MQLGDFLKCFPMELFSSLTLGGPLSSFLWKQNFNATFP